MVLRFAFERRRQLSTELGRLRTAAGEYAALDREVMKQAPWAPFGTLTLGTFVSDKIDLYHVTEINEPARRMGENLARAGDVLQRALEDLEAFKDLDPRWIEIHLEAVRRDIEAD